MSFPPDKKKCNKAIEGKNSTKSKMICRGILCNKRLEVKIQGFKFYFSDFAYAFFSYPKIFVSNVINMTAYVIFISK